MLCWHRAYFNRDLEQSASGTSSDPGEADPLTDFSLSVRPASAYTVFVLDSGSVLVSEDAAQPI